MIDSNWSDRHVQRKEPISTTIKQIVDEFKGTSEELVTELFQLELDD